MPILVPDAEAIRLISELKGKYVCFTGAGTSVEAGVKTANMICDEILEQKRPKNLVSSDEIKRWAKENLNWDDPERRYTTCLQIGKPGQAFRVQYFRQLLRNVRPAFCHFATALLMKHGQLKKTCLTVNFDRLLENAFTELGETECQSIRSEEEARYWDAGSDRYFVVKLHGECDTRNVLNTADETLSVGEAMIEVAVQLFQNSGALVLGTAGNESSVHSLFNSLRTRLEERRSNLLEYGLLWGIYMGQAKKDGISDDDQLALLAERLKQGVVSRQMRDFMDWAGQKVDTNFCFFPVWGAGNFLAELIDRLGGGLKDVAEPYLDHEMRLRSVFRKVGLSSGVVEDHIKELNEKFRRIVSGPKQEDTDWVFLAEGPGLKVRVGYGDIISKRLLEDKEFQNVRRAVVSPEDTCISAGGGVARQLVQQAGSHTILNELAKLWPINHGDVAVTSGGKLPVHYIFHAAAMRIGQDRSIPKVEYSVTRSTIAQVIEAVLEMATVLKVQAIWIPLLGTGAGNILPQDSYEAILTGLEGHSQRSGIATDKTVNIVIYDRHTLPYNIVETSLRSQIGNSFVISAL